jgi:hypothetical protein
MLGFVVTLMCVAFLIAVVWKPAGSFFRLFWEQATESNSRLTYRFIILIIGSQVIGFLSPRVDFLVNFGTLVGVGGFIWMLIRGGKERENEK